MSTQDDDTLFDETTTSTQAQEGATGATAAAQEGTEGENPGEGATGEKTASGTPPEGQEGTTEGANEKMIPESRFKAALRDVQTKLDEANNKLAAATAAPVPDKDEDPEGYNLHVRMEASKTIMREMVPDYDEVIKTYKELADANPALNEQVAAHPIPAKFAYDIAKRHLELQELSKLKDSDDWKEFQEYKKMKTSQQAQTQTTPASQAKSSVAQSLTSKVPNLNRATDVSSSVAKNDDTEELFSGAL